jgi:hypothetical protein
MLGGIALAMVRREVPAGAQLIARWPSDDADPPDGSLAERRVDVATLPFATS